MDPTPLPQHFVHRTLSELLEHQTQVHGNRLALVARAHDGSIQRLTYRQLLWSADRFAQGIESLGLRKGAHVGILADNNAAYEAIVTLLACVRAGYVVAPINARFTRPEIDHCIALADIEALVFDQCHEELLDGIAREHETLRHLVAIGAPANDAEDIAQWETLFAHGDARNFTPVALVEDDVSEILFTSGTTARPKASVMTHRSAVASAHGFADAMTLDCNATFQSFFPFYTTALLRCILYPCWATGATAIVDPGMVMEDILHRIAEERTTHYMAVPTFYAFLLEIYDPKRHDLSSITMCNAGGAAMSAELTRRILALLPGIDIRQTYGQTEGGPSGTVLKGADAHTRPGSVGKAWLDSEVRVVDEQSMDVGPEQVGEIIVRGPGLFTGYYKNPETTRQTLKGGWLYSGDLGRFDADGFLYVVDRKKDLVIRGGHNIGTLEVESVIAQHPDVAEVAVIGIDHPKLVEDLLALVRTTKGSSLRADELQAFCKQHLADFKTPRKFLFVEDFPRTGMGKILKSELRAQYRGILAKDGAADPAPPTRPLAAT